MSSIDWVPELAAALDELVPPSKSSPGDWDDVVGRVGRRGERWLGRRRPSRRLRLALVMALLFLLLTGAATATYLLVRGSGGIALGSGAKLLVFDPSGSGLRAVATCAKRPNCAILEPTWSPDGTQIAFLRGGVRPGTRQLDLTLYVAAANGGGTRRLAACGDCSDSGGQGHLAWSPDGRWIAFSRVVGRQASLWLVAANGGGLHRLTDCGTLCGDDQPAWSPDGYRIVFKRGGQTRQASGIYTIRPDGSELTRITSGSDNPAWSPDGRRIAFDRTTDSIAVVDAATHRVHVLLTGSRGSGPGFPSWSPDGRKLVFFYTPGTPGNPGHYRAEVWTMNADGSDKKRLYRSPCCVGLWAPPIWSPDGRLIAFSADSAGGTFVINAGGGGLRRISPVLTDALSWQPAPKGESK